MHADDTLQNALSDRYRIERELGAGGMATVYLAEDLRHDRRVAIKVLKPELAAVLGAERFVQEIKTTASLQHPHILPLFDSGTAGSFLFYVMPYIQGETIRDKLNRETQFGIEESIRIAREVADALDYAHRHGVIHRDIKPENILLHDGRAMVMDFGIALAVSAAAGGRMTETGLSLGTPHYMSPEQATAERDISARSDVYSIGSVLYEMLTGNPPHTGATAQQVIMKIITEPAEPVTKFRRSVPGHVAEAIAQSLEKLPADRFESAKAFSDALANANYTNAIAGATGSRAHARRRRSVPVLALALLAAVSTAGWIVAATRRSAEPARHLRFTVSIPDSMRIRPDNAGQNFTISHDGSAIVYRGGSATDQLYMRALDDLSPRAIPGSAGAAQAKFSRDGKWLAFVQTAERHLVKIPLAGGPALPIADSVSHFSWGSDFIVFTGQGNRLFRVSASGGTPTLLATPNSAANELYFWPFVLPDDKAILLDIVKASDQAGGQLAAMRLDDGKVIPLGVTGRNPRYVDTGHILFARLDGTICAVPFDRKALRVTGPAVTVLDNVYVKGGGAAEFGVSDDGTLFYVQGQAFGEMLAVDRSGSARVLLAEKRLYQLPKFSPTGDRFAFALSDRTSFSTSDIWVYDTRTHTTTRLTNDGNSTAPTWMADGDRIVWLTRDSTGVRVHRQRWDGSGTPETLFAGDRAITAVAPSRKGNLFAVMRNGAFTDIYLAEGDPPGTPKPFIVTVGGEGGAVFSPDNQWVAYYGDGSGRREVYVSATTGGGGRHQISTDGGGEPAWGSDGRTLYYRANGQLIVATIQTTPAFTVTSREALFPDRYRAGGTHATYDISPDGKAFLMVGGSDDSQRLIVMTGWLDELRARMAQATKQ